ncbi:MAG: CO dehydrogenase/acetyl-CoA synthase subunit delta [Candidatus Bipolaricaulaceae bacterium]
MPVPEVRESFSQAIYTVRLGASWEEGGTRTKVVTVGGERALPFHHFDGEIPNPPVVAMEVWDIPPEDWPDPVRAPFQGVLDSPGKWARKCVEEYGADLICLRLVGTDPAGENRAPAEAASVVKEVLAAVGVPLIIWGCGNPDKDNEVFPVVGEAAAGENCLLGTITQDNYKTLVAVATAYKHKLIAESPVDINIAKQVNILAMDAGFPLEDLVIYPSTGALGYGIEYVYSIMERTRLAGLGGDKFMAQPILCDIGKEAWAVKEARASKEEQPSWGDERLRGPLWEATTAYMYLLAGADILIMRHPQAVRAVKEMIQILMRGRG